MTSLRRGFVLVVLAGLWLALAGGVAAADPPTFGTPNATAAFGKAVTFEQPITFAEPPARVEVLLRFPEAIGPLVSEIDPPSAAGAAALRYVFDAKPGDLAPNTRIAAQWRITSADGVETLGPATEILYTDDRFTWKERTDGLVTLHWYEGDDAFADRALRVASDGLSKAQDFLGVTEAEPVDFFVYATSDDIYAALAPDRENVGGQAFPELRTLFARISPKEIGDAWVGTVIPHEITHLVFHTAVRNPYGSPPKWVDEGVATYLSEGFTGEYRDAVEEAVASGTLIPLTGLQGQFPTTFAGFNLGYAQSVSAIDFMVRAHGDDGLQDLIRHFGEGQADGSFMSALGMDQAAFDAAWRADLGAGEPIVHGPQPGPAGPVPEGWGGADGIPAPNVPGRLTMPDVLYVGLSGVFAVILVGGLLIYLSRRPRGGIA